MELQTQLQQAEVDAALTAASVTTHGVRLDGRMDRTVGPVVSLDVNLEGIPTKALVDTGSRVALVFLKFIAEVFAQKCQSHMEWGGVRGGEASQAALTDYTRGLCAFIKFGGQS